MEGTRTYCRARHKDNGRRPQALRCKLADGREWHASMRPRMAEWSTNARNITTQRKMPKDLKPDAKQKPNASLIYINVIKFNF